MNYRFWAPRSCCVDRDATLMMFQFEQYTLDIARGCLRVADREVELRPKSFEVLRLLVENAGRLVTKDELIRTVWANVTVTDESLTRCISEVRQALADKDQKMIRTVPRRGYRFSTPVSQTVSTPQSKTANEGSETDNAADASFLDKPPSDRACVAVLPFANLSGDLQQEYLSDGITEDIITDLSRFPELMVIARNSTFRYKGSATDVRQIGRELGARYVLEGSIRRAGDRIRINAQLIDAITGIHRWAERYDRELSDVFAVQDEVARTIVTVLAAHVTKAETDRTLLKPPATWEAYDYYLRGSETFWHGLTERTIAYVHEARRLLEKSISIDPNYARAYAVLARTHVHTYLEPRDCDYLGLAGLDHAHALAQEAVRLDPQLPQAHSQLGWVLTFMRRPDEAVAEFECAISLNPNFTDSSFGLVLTYAGKPMRAVEMLRANVRLDPFQPPARLGYLGHAYYMLKRYAESIPPLRECAARMSIFRVGHLWLAAACAQHSQIADARAAAADVLRIEPDFTIDRWKCTAAYKDPADAEHLFEGLRKAGLP
jgi:adenylate cyclase